MESFKAIADDTSQKENNPFLTKYLKERSLQREVPLSNADQKFALDQGDAKSQQPLKVRNMTTQAQNHRPHDQAQLVDKFRKLRQWQQQQQESMFRQQQQQMETLRMEQNKLQSILAAQRKLQGQTATSTPTHPPNFVGTVSNQAEPTREGSVTVTSQLQQGSVRLQAPLDMGSRVQVEDEGFESVRNGSDGFPRSIPTFSLPSSAMGQMDFEMQTRQPGPQHFGEPDPKFSVNDKDRFQESLPHLNETVYPVMWNSSNYRFPLRTIPPVVGTRPISEQPVIGSAMTSNPLSHLGMTKIPPQFQSPVISQRPGDMFQNNPATNNDNCPELNLERIDTSQYDRNPAMTPDLERLWSHNAGVKSVADIDSQVDEHSEADTMSGVYPLYDSEPDMGFNEIDDENDEDDKDVESDDEEELEESNERDRTVIDLQAQSQDSMEMNEKHMEENCQTEVGDEMPIKPGIGGSSQAKTFEELLEEQLKLDAEASKATAKTQSTTQKPQRTFLRKGQGLARFKGKSASAKVTTKTQEPAVPLTTAQQKKQKKTGNAVAASSQWNSKSGGVSGGPVAQTKVTRKVASRSPQVMTEASVKSQQIRESKPFKTQPASSDGKPVAIAVTKPAAMPTSVISDEPEESNPPSVFNSIDASFQMRLKELEEKQELEEEELEEFELLEQAAANASFSSNSSVVVKVLAKARGGSAQISKNNTMRGAGNKPENRGAGGILSPVDTGYGSGDGKGAVSIDESRPLPVVELREPHENESEDDDSDVTLQEMSLDSALELDSGQDEKRQATGDLQKVLAPAYLNPPSTESDNEFNDEDTWAAIKKQAGTDFENAEKGGEVDSDDDDDDDDEDDSDVTISDIFPLVTSTPPVALKRGQPPKSQVADAIEDERMLAASTPPTSTLVTKLFPQLKPKQKAAPAVAKQATSDVPKAQGQEKEPVDTVQSAAVREKLKELEAEIEKFRTENAALAKIRKEREEGLKKLQAEIAVFEKQKTDELERLEQFREEEMRKLRRERRVFEKYQKAARSMPDKKEREEIESLREQMADLQEELKRRESRWSAASTRSRQKIEVLEEQNKELQEEVKLLEHYRLQQWREEEQAKAKEEEESRPKKPLLRKTAKATEEEPGPKLPVRHRSPPMRAALAEVLPRSTPENATIDPETRLPSAAIQLDKNNNQSSSSRQDENTPSDVLYNEMEEISSALKPVDDNNHDTMKSKRSPRRRSKTPERGEKFKRNVHFQDEEKYDENNARESSNSDERNRQDTREIVHPDGKVEKVNSDGSRVISFANGTRKDISVDGQTITVTFFNGDVKQIMPDQRVMYYYSDVQTTHTTYPDGLEVLQFPSKQIEKHYPDGTKEIIFPDQTIKYLHPNGAEECVFSDGTVQKVSVDGERTIEFPNGQRETHTKFYKKREYPDGTVKTVYPDGRTETRYASGRVRVKDREGRILVDAPHQDR